MCSEMSSGKRLISQKWLTIAVLLLGFLQIGQVHGQSAVYDLELKNLLKMQTGLGWPRHMLVARGQEALMKLVEKFDQQESCTVISPRGEVFDVSSPPSTRYQQWSDGCGLRVRQVAPTDEGRWRLTTRSAGVNSTEMTGWIEVNVNDQTPSYAAPPISLQDGESLANVELTSLDNAYCMVTQPFAEASLVAGHCQVTLDRTTRAVQGNWDILVGLPGQVSELHIQRQVAVEAERLDVGFIHDTNANKVHMYCNIVNTSKNVTFCRFQKTTNSFGYNVMEGLSDGAHSYYGEGFVRKDCGMTIEYPTAQDYGTWRCSVGSQQWVGTAVQQQTPMQALINVSPTQMSSRIQRGLRSQTEERNEFVQEDMSFTLSCRIETALSYCWFLHPNGTQFSPMPITSEDQTFWYAGQSLQSGDCGITFARALASDAGSWRCHMGVANELGVEHSDTISVRVTGPLAADEKAVGVTVGRNATLLCHTANGNKPLDYCRFVAPNYMGISIDSTVTQENAILDRFFFMPERSLNYGDCSLVISSVQPEDEGVWTCAAMINGDAMESSDTVEIYFGDASPPSPGTPDDEPRRRVSQAGIVGMSIGAIALIVLLVGVVWNKNGRPVPWRFDRRRGVGRVSSRPLDLMSMNTSSTRASVGSSISSGSGSSGEVELHTGPTVTNPQAHFTRDPLNVGVSAKTE